MYSACIEMCVGKEEEQRLNYQPQGVNFWLLGTQKVHVHVLQTPFGWVPSVHNSNFSTAAWVTSAGISTHGSGDFDTVRHMYQKRLTVVWLIVLSADLDSQSSDAGKQWETVKLSGSFWYQRLIVMEHQSNESDTTCLQKSYYHISLKELSSESAAPQYIACISTSTERVVFEKWSVGLAYSQWWSCGTLLEALRCSCAALCLLGAQPHLTFLHVFSFPCSHTQTTTNTLFGHHLYL